MRVTADTAPLLQLEAKLSRAGKVLTPARVGSLLRVAANPALALVRQGAPVGKRVRRGADSTYDRGGATRRDARIRVVPPVGGREIVRVLIGISKKRGRVGWRTHFITAGTQHSRANDFIGRAEQQAMPLINGTFGEACRRLLNRELL